MCVPAFGNFVEYDSPAEKKIQTNVFPAVLLACWAQHTHICEDGDAANPNTFSMPGQQPSGPPIEATTILSLRSRKNAYKLTRPLGDIKSLSRPNHTVNCGSISRSPSSPKRANYEGTPHTVGPCYHGKPPYRREPFDSDKTCAAETTPAKA